MKKIKMIFRWMLLSILMQSAVLAYFNYIYLPNRGTFRATAYEAGAVPLRNRNLRLPEGASGVCVSFDGLYVAYLKGERIIIADIEKKKDLKELTAAGGKFTYYRWLPDREMLIYGIMEPGGKRGSVRIATYDVVPDLERSYPDVGGLPEGSSVIDIELSPLTNVVYPMIKTSDARARIYKFDIMDNLSLVMKTDLDTVIKETMYADNLVYQAAGGAIRIRSGKTGRTARVPAEEAEFLLAVDDYDYIYAGDMDEKGMLTAVCRGKAGQGKDEWTRFALPGLVKPGDVFITPEGAIYVADRAVNEIIGLENRAGIKYEGELLTVLNDYVVSAEGNRLILKVLEK